MTVTRLIVRLEADIPATQLVPLTRELARDLSRAGIWMRLDEAAEQTRGSNSNTSPFLTLALVTSDAINTMMECFKAYLFREPSLTISAYADDMRLDLKVTARNVETSTIRTALQAMASTSSE